MTKTDVSGVFDEASGYTGIHGDIVALLEGARHAAARSVNAVMTASYWEIGRRIVEFEQGGQDRAVYGQALLKRLLVDLTRRFGRGVFRTQSRTDAPFLSDLATRGNFADTVCEIGSLPS